MVQPPADDADAARQSLTNLLTDTLPTDQVVAAFGYGSGVFSQDLETDQTSNAADPKVVDLIVVVRDASAFHAANLARNPSHYWMVRPTTSSPHTTAAWCTWWQRHEAPSWLGSNPGLYFFLTPTLKYGVIQVEDLQEDLSSWKYLYLAGRLQKPVLTLTMADASAMDAQLQASMASLQHTRNLPAALAAALLLLSVDERIAPTTMSATLVFAQIARLSYLGDFRVRYGAEDPHKITRLVEGPGQVARFSHLYAAAAKSLQAQGLLTIIQQEDTTSTTTSSTKNQGPQWSWDRSKRAQQLLAQHLPFAWDAHANHDLSERLARIVAPAARYQSFKGIVTAGPQKAWKYAARKLSKGLLRR
jgi:translocator assembly and maintenance protein 41